MIVIRIIQKQNINKVGMFKLNYYLTKFNLIKIIFSSIDK